MFEKFKKDYCIEFYKAYDSITKNLGFHTDFYRFIKNKFLHLKSIEDATKSTMDAFIEFIYAKMYSSKFLPPNEINRRREMYRKIFEFCYKKTFNVDNIPSTQEEIKRSIFKSKLACLKIFKNVQSCISTEEFLEDDKKFVNDLIEEFWFIHTFCNFIEKTSCEKIDFFKRFFGDYPFNNPEIPSEENRLWNEKHSQEFEIIKNDKKESAENLKSARQWFKEQLETVKFENLSEEQKSVFFKEMFVSFGNISVAKTGGAKGYLVQLKNLFYLGRYYNIHPLPLKYIEKTQNQAVLESIAHETWQNYRDYGFIPKEPIEDAIRRGQKKMVHPKEKDDYGKNARREPMERVSKLLPSNKTLDKGDDYESATNKYLSNIDMQKLINAKNKQEVEDYLKHSVTSFLTKENIATVKRIGPSEQLIKDFSKQSIEQSLILTTLFPIHKPGIGIITHYDIYKNQNKETPSIIEEIAKTILMK